MHKRNQLPNVHKSYTGNSYASTLLSRGQSTPRRSPLIPKRPLMPARFAHRVLSSSKRLPISLQAAIRALLTALLTASLCMLVSACSDDSQAPDSSTDTSATTPDQNTAATSLPSFAQQTAQGQSALPAHTFQTPPPAPSQMGVAAAASDSLAPPVIHTVD